MQVAPCRDFATQNACQNTSAAATPCSNAAPCRRALPRAHPPSRCCRAAAHAPAWAAGSHPAAGRRLHGRRKSSAQVNAQTRWHKRCGGLSVSASVSASQRQRQTWRSQRTQWQRAASLPGRLELSKALRWGIPPAAGAHPGRCATSCTAPPRAASRSTPP